VQTGLAGNEHEDDEWGGEHFQNRAPIFFEQQPRLARARTMRSEFNKTATIRVKTAEPPREEQGRKTGTAGGGGAGRGYGSEL